jgi:peptide/nickel transport system permease protein
VQYVRWLGDIASGQLGKSFFRGDTVAEQILHRGPISAEIAVLSLIVSWVVGLPVGILSAFKPNSLPDGLARALSVLFIAVPGFWLGMLIVLALLFWFGYKAPIIIVHVWQSPWENLQMVIGPALVLGLAPGACWRSSATTSCGRPGPRGCARASWSCGTPCPTRCCR